MIRRSIQDVALNLSRLLIFEKDMLTYVRRSTYGYDVWWGPGTIQLGLIYKI